MRHLLSAAQCQLQNRKLNVHFPGCALQATFPTLPNLPVWGGRAVPDDERAGHLALEQGHSLLLRSAHDEPRVHLNLGTLRACSLYQPAQQWLLVEGAVGFL